MSAGDWKDFYYSAQKGDMALASYYLNQGIDINYQHPEIMETALMAAINSGQTEMALFLLAEGADPELKSGFDEMTPLEEAKRQNNKELILALKKLI